MRRIWVAAAIARQLRMMRQLAAVSKMFPGLRFASQLQWKNRLHLLKYALND